MIRLIKFLFAATRAYRGALKHGSYYTAITYRDVPQICCFVGVGREAWRISQRAIQEFSLSKTNFDH